MNPARLVKEKLRSDSPPGPENPTPAIRHPRIMSVLPFRRSLLSLCVLAVLSAGVVAPAAAQQEPRDRGGQGGGQQQEPPRRDEPQRAERPRGDSLADSVRRFERSRGDRVLSAERMQSDGRDVNRIKAMDDRGRVRAYVDDPAQRRQPPRDDRSRGNDD